METTIQSSTSVSSTSNINGKVSSYNKNTSDFKHKNTLKPKEDIDVNKMAEKDLNSEGRFHNTKKMNSKIGFKKPEGFIRKTQGNLDDGIRKDKMTLHKGDAHKTLDLHQAFSMIKRLRQNKKFKRTNFHEVGHMENIERLKTMFSLAKGGEEHDSN